MLCCSDLHPGGGSPTTPVHTPYENNAAAVSDGKQLFSAYNCVGCHAHGGGGIGPALRDDEWSYGHEADQIYHSILEGRPNGMPAFRGKIPDYQIWQLAAYVRSLSGLLPKDVAPNRDDHMSGPPAESSTTAGGTRKTPRCRPLRCGDAITLACSRPCSMPRGPSPRASPACGG